MTLRHFLKYTAPGRVALIPYRFLLGALPHAARQLGTMIQWAFTSKEHYNHTYHLTPLNQSYLAAYVAVVTGHDLPAIEGYIRELETDHTLRAALQAQTLASPDRHNCDLEPRYGRRLGWYALVRATKPRVVLETGVDRGLGTAVLAAALQRNTAEGRPGLVHATDIMPDCGHLLAADYKPYCRLHLGDSVETLKQFPEPVDIFLHDSDHRPEYERAEYQAIAPRLHAGSLVLSDNSQQTDELLRFAAARGQSFLYFQDVPRAHWWPGDGLGAAFPPGRKTVYQGEPGL